MNVEDKTEMNKSMFIALDLARKDWLHGPGSRGVFTRTYFGLLNVIIDSEPTIREGYDKLNKHRTEQNLSPIAPQVPIPGLSSTDRNT